MLPEVVAAFLRERPRVSVEMRIMPVSACGKRSMSGRSISRSRRSWVCRKELDSERLYSDAVVFFAAPGMPIASKEQVTVADLAGETLVGTFVDSQWRRILHAFEDAGFRVKRQLTMLPPEGVKSMVSERLGIGVLFASSIRREIADGTFVPLQLAAPPLHEDFCIAMNPKGSCRRARRRSWTTCVRAYRRRRTAV